ncbi:MAG: DUF6504 family protein [Dehalococcoidia bacterium]
MSKLFRDAIRLEVEEGYRHKPVTFIYKRRRARVRETLKQWRVVRGWWKRPVEREYFQVKTESGTICELYRDLLTGAWYLQRIHD